MPRALRLEFEGTLYCVITRGDNRQAIFKDKENQQYDLRNAMGPLGVGRSDLRYPLAENLPGDKSGSGGGIEAP